MSAANFAAYAFAVLATVAMIAAALARRGEGCE